MSHIGVRNSRRAFLGTLTMGAAAFAARGSFADELVRTPRQTEGPFYPDKLPLDTDNDLLIINDTIKPVRYTGRTRHIHYKIRRGGKELLTTQCYVKGEPANEKDGIYRVSVNRKPATPSPSISPPSPARASENWPPTSTSSSVSRPRGEMSERCTSRRERIPRLERADCLGMDFFASPRCNLLANHAPTVATLGAR